MERLFDMMNDRRVTDYKFIVQGEEIHCHRVVLALASPYFDDIFTGNAIVPEMERMPLINVSSASVRQVITYCYTGALKVPLQNAKEISSLAVLFKLRDVVDEIDKFIASNLSEENVIGFYFHAMKTSLDDTNTKAIDIIRENLLGVSEYPEFKQVTAQQLVDFLSAAKDKEGSNVKLKSLLNWTQYKMEDRRGLFLDLLRKINLRRCSVDYLLEILTRYKDSLFKSHEASRMVTEALGELHKKN